MKGFMYILECSDGTYYTGSANDIERRLEQHRLGYGAVYTKNRLPVTLAYIEEYERVEDAFKREKQVQNWSHEKKRALIAQEYDRLHELAKCSNSGKNAAVE